MWQKFKEKFKDWFWYNGGCAVRMFKNAFSFGLKTKYKNKGDK